MRKKLLFITILLLSAFFGLNYANALTNYVDFSNSTLFDFSDFSYTRYHDTGYVSNNYFNNTITIVFEPEDDDLEFNYKTLEGDNIEIAIQFCADSDFRGVEGGNGVQVDYFYNTGNQCIVYRENQSTLFGNEFIAYLYVPIYSISYDVSNYPSVKPPNQFTIVTKFSLNLKYSMNPDTSFYGFTEDMLPAYFIPSYVYYQRVNYLRQNDGLEPISREERITSTDVIDDVTSNFTVFERISMFVTDFFSSIANTLKSLFVPSDMSFMTDFEETITTKLGFIAEIPIRIINFAIDLASSSWDSFTSLTLPTINIFGYYFWENQEIDLTEAINIFRPYRYVTDVVCVVICVNTLNKWRETIFGGGN